MVNKFQKLQISLNIVLYLWHSFWHIIGPYYLHKGSTSRSCKDCINYGYEGSYDCKTVSYQIGAYMLLYEFHLRQCEVVTPMEQLLRKDTKYNWT